MKTNYVKDLTHQLEMTEKLLEQSRLDHEREVLFNRETQQREITLQDQLTHVKTLMDRDPYILVLVDGDTANFLQESLNKGVRGGKEIADSIYNATTRYIKQCLPHLNNPKTVVRIYANFTELEKTMTLPKPAVMQQFVSGFNSGWVTFDFVDSGYRTISKVSGKLAVQCRAQS